MEKDGGAAFPVMQDSWNTRWAGMTLRDYFAGQYLAGLAADGDYKDPARDAAELCYKFADAMLKARDRDA